MSRAAERGALLLGLVAAGVALGGLASAAAGPASAAGPAQRALQGPIQVSARHAEFDERGKRMLYRGDVRLVSNELELRGDRLELVQSGRGLYQARITGTPARLLHAAVGDAPALSARAQEITYDTRASTVALNGRAVLNRGDDELEGERIRYNAATRRIQASGANGGQVRLVIQPPDGADKDKAVPGGSTP